MMFIPAITECELERLGHAIGDVFAPASDNFLDATDGYYDVPCV
jgi:hypothetical protein